MKNRSIFVAFEGLSASGKSSLAEAAAERLGAIYYKTPASPFMRVRAEVDAQADMTARYHFYLAGTIQASAEIRRLLETFSVMCDRYLLTTECFHRVCGVATLGGYDAFAHTLLVPDLTVLVTCPEDIRQVRLPARGLTPNDEDEERRGVRDRFLAEYRRHDVVEVDNSGTPASTLEYFLEVLRMRKLWQG